MQQGLFCQRWVFSREAGRCVVCLLDRDFSRDAIHPCATVCPVESGVRAEAEVLRIEDEAPLFAGLADALR